VGPRAFCGGCASLTFSPKVPTYRSHVSLPLLQHFKPLEEVILPFLVSSDSMSQPGATQSRGDQTPTSELYGFHFDRFLEDESNFFPRNGHRIIEIEEPEAGSELSISDNVISEAEILLWLRQVIKRF